MTVAIRAAKATDRDLIIHAWVESFRLANTAGMIAMDDWWDVMAPQVVRVLDRAGSRTLVAYETEEAGGVADLYGFITFDREPEPPWRSLPIVFYVYVKAPYRREGYARRLFDAAGIHPAKPFVYACSTPAEAEIRRARKIPSAQWRPLLARYPRRPMPEEHRK